MKFNISHISIIAVVGLLLASCSSPKSIYMGSDYGNSKYIYDKKDWPREDKRCYYWNTGNGENWYIAQNKKTGKRCVIDKNRNIIVPEYSNVVYENGAFIATNELGRNAMFNTHGKCLIDFEKGFTITGEWLDSQDIPYYKCYDGSQNSYYNYNEYGNEIIGSLYSLRKDTHGHIYSIEEVSSKVKPTNYYVGSSTTERNGYKWYSTSSGTNKKGAQTSDGTTIVPAEYSKVEYVPYNDGYFVVWKDDNSGVYNNYGNNLISVDRGYSTVIKSCSDGRYYYRVCKGGRYGACDIRGREIVEPRYYHVILCDGVFLYKDDDGEWKPLNVGIDSHNRVVKNPKHTPRDKSHYEMTLEQNLLEESFGRYVGVEQMSTSANGSRAFKMVFDDKILFEFGKYNLNSSALDYIDRVASALEKLPSARVRITGYTDNIGGLESNQRLSTNRAQAVGNRLKQKGISASRIITKGVPLANYVATNDTEEGRALNRRVEIIIEPM